MSEQGDTARRAGAIAGVGLVVRIASQVMSLVLLLLAGRFLTIELFGVFALAVILLNLGQVLLYSGVYNYVLKEPGIEPSLKTAFTLQCLVAAAFCLAILLCGAIITALGLAQQLGPLILATAPLPVLGLIACWQEAVALREGKVRFYYVCMFLAEAAAFATGVALLISGAGVWSLIISRYVSAVILSTGLSFAAGALPGFGFDRGHADRILKYSLGLYGSSGLTFFTQFGADIVIGAVLNTRAVGLFRMGTRTATAAYDVFAQTTRVLSWQVVGRMAREGRMDDPIWIRMYALVLMVMMAALGGMAVLAAPLTETILGPEWLPMVPILQVVCAVRVLSAFDLIGSAHLAASDDTQFLFRTRIAEASVFAISLAISVSFGALAVAFSLLPPTLVVFGLLLRRTLKSTATPITQFFGEILPALCIATAAILPPVLLQLLLPDLSALRTLAFGTLAGIAGGLIAGLVVFRGWLMDQISELSTAVLPAAPETLPDMGDAKATGAN